jgi:hypothetical protein
MLAPTLLATSVASGTPVIWTLTNVQFSEGSTVTGSFSYDADTKAVSNVDVTFSGGTYYKSGHFSFGASGVTPVGIYVDLSTDPIASINTVGNYVISLPLSPAPTNGGGVVQITNITGCVVISFQGQSQCSDSAWGGGTLPPDPPMFLSGRLVAASVLTVTASLPAGEESVAYPPAGSTAQLVAGGTPPYQIITNGLPPGLKANSNGTLSGVPALGTAGSYTVTVSASDSAGATIGPLELTLTIAPVNTTTFYPYPQSALVWPTQGGYTPSMPYTGGDSCSGPRDFTLNIPPPFEVQGGDLRLGNPLFLDLNGNIQWSFFSDVQTFALPAGHLIPVVNGQIQIPGLPKTFGPVSAPNQSPGVTSQETYTISASGTVINESWSATYSTSGGGHGTSAVSSTYDVTTGVQAISAKEVIAGSGCTTTLAGTGTANWKLGNTPVVVTTKSPLPAAQAFSKAITSVSAPPYVVQLQAAGGAPPYTWQVTGLPPGLTYSPSGLISGSIMRDTPDIYRIGLKVTDSASTSSTPVTVMLPTSCGSPLTPLPPPSASCGIVAPNYLAPAVGDDRDALIAEHLSRGILLHPDATLPLGLDVVDPNVAKAPHCTDFTRTPPFTHFYSSFDAITSKADSTYHLSAYPACFQWTLLSGLLTEPGNPQGPFYGTGLDAWIYALQALQDPVATHQVNSSYRNPNRNSVIYKGATTQGAHQFGAAFDLSLCANPTQAVPANCSSAELANLVPEWNLVAIAARQAHFKRIEVLNFKGPCDAAGRCVHADMDLGPQLPYVNP